MLLKSCFRFPFGGIKSITLHCFSFIVLKCSIWCIWCCMSKMGTWEITGKDFECSVLLQTGLERRWVFFALVFILILMYSIVSFGSLQLQHLKNKKLVATSNQQLVTCIYQSVSKHHSTKSCLHSNKCLLSNENLRMKCLTLQYIEKQIDNSLSCS